jgi:hypothetical protein
MHFRSLAVVSLTAVAISPSLMRAQDALPYSAGQWGLEASASANPEGGVLKFFSPKTALVLTGSYSKLSTKDEVTDPFGGAAASVKTSQSQAAARLGLRFYRPIATSLVQFTTVGITAQHVSQNQDDPFSGGQFDVTLNNFGAFGEVGAQYHLGPRFAFGAAFRAEYLHVTGKTTGSSGATGKTTGNGFSFDFTPIRASIFF